MGTGRPDPSRTPKSYHSKPRPSELFSGRDFWRRYQYHGSYGHSLADSLGAWRDNMSGYSVPTYLVIVLWCCAPALGGGSGGWVEFSNHTSTRLVSDPAVGSGDLEEKDYAWGDVDKDGDIDLVCVRKQPFTTPGRRTNVLFMNEGIADGQAVEIAV